MFPPPFPSLRTRILLFINFQLMLSYGRFVLYMLLFLYFYTKCVFSELTRGGSVSGSSCHSEPRRGGEGRWVRSKEGSGRWVSGVEANGRRINGGEASGRGVQGVEPRRMNEGEANVRRISAYSQETLEAERRRSRASGKQSQPLFISGKNIFAIETKISTKRFIFFKFSKINFAEKQQFLINDFHSNWICLQARL